MSFTLTRAMSHLVPCFWMGQKVELLSDWHLSNAYQTQYNLLCTWLNFFYAFCFLKLFIFVLDNLLTFFSLNVLDAIGLGSEVTDGVIAADADLSSLVLCGKAFCDANGIKKALSALSEPIILSRGGLLLHPK